MTLNLRGVLSRSRGSMRCFHVTAPLNVVCEGGVHHRGHLGVRTAGMQLMEDSMKRSALRLGGGVRIMIYVVSPIRVRCSVERGSEWWSVIYVFLCCYGDTMDLISR